jgi:hypothetical protein
MRRPSFIGTIYLVIGVLVAVSEGYMKNIGSIGDLLSLIVAVLIWPLILLGVDINISTGDGERRALAALLFINERPPFRFTRDHQSAGSPHERR